MQGGGLLRIDSNQNVLPRRDVMKHEAAVLAGDGFPHTSPVRIPPTPSAQLNGHARQASLCAALDDEPCDREEFRDETKFELLRWGFHLELDLSFAHVVILILPGLGSVYPRGEFTLRRERSLLIRSKRDRVRARDRPRGGTYGDLGELHRPFFLVDDYTSGDGQVM